MGRRRVEIGVLLLAAVGLMDAVSPWLWPAPPTAPASADLLACLFGLATLGLLAAWWVTRSRALLWPAVVLRAVSGFFCVLAFLDATTASLAALQAVAYVATVAGLVIVAPALAARTRTVAA